MQLLRDSWKVRVKGCPVSLSSSLVPTGTWHIKKGQKSKNKSISSRLHLSNRLPDIFTHTIHRYFGLDVSETELSVQPPRPFPVSVFLV